MKNVIHLTVVAQGRRASEEAAWQRWLELNRIAKESEDIKDGLAAGRAYREFIELAARQGK